mgnify:FL=1
MKGTLPKKTLLLYELRLLIVLFLPSAAAAAASLFAGWLVFVGIGLFALYAVLAAWYLPMLYKSFVIFADDDTVRITYGVMFKTTQIMPYPRMIFAQGFSTPIARKLKLCAVSLKAARTQIFIPEINETDAKMLINTVAGENTDE